MDPMDDAKTWHPLASLKFQKDGVFFSYSVHKVLQDVQYPHVWKFFEFGSVGCIAVLHRQNPRTWKLVERPS